MGAWGLGKSLGRLIWGWAGEQAMAKVEVGGDGACANSCVRRTGKRGRGSDDGNRLDDTKGGWERGSESRGLGGGNREA